MYSFITSDNKEISVVKGAKNKIPYRNLITLLKENTKLELTQDIWYRNIKQGTITIKEDLYHLKVTSSKRNLIYKNNIKIVK